MPTLNPAATALILIDLQKGILARSLAPHGASDVVTRAKQTTAQFRAAGAAVVLVNVAFSPDGKDRLSQPVDQPNPATPTPPDFSDLVPGLAQPGDILITKRQWGAFHETGLDLQLRRRGITTIVLGGVATNYGVESTARQAYERGYTLLIAEDLTSTMSADMHAFPMQKVFPRISRIIQSSDVSFG